MGAADGPNSEPIVGSALEPSMPALDASEPMPPTMPSAIPAYPRSLFPVTNPATDRTAPTAVIASVTVTAATASAKVDPAITAAVTEILAISRLRSTFDKLPLREPHHDV